MAEEKNAAGNKSGTDTVRKGYQPINDGYKPLVGQTSTTNSGEAPKPPVGGTGQSSGNKKS